MSVGQVALRDWLSIGYQDRLLELIEQQPDFVQPEARRNEVLARIREGLNDVPISRTGTGGWGIIAPGTLEMSNVDLALEFTELIRSQRGFQANSRVVTSSDELLQEIVNMKR